jgi:hypothetical protein
LCGKLIPVFLLLFLLHLYLAFMILKMPQTDWFKIILFINFMTEIYLIQIVSGLDNNCVQIEISQVNKFSYYVNCTESKKKSLFFFWKVKEYLKPFFFSYYYFIFLFFTLFQLIKQNFNIKVNNINIQEGERKFKFYFKVVFFFFFFFFFKNF